MRSSWASVPPPAASPTQTVPTGWPSCSAGPATPVSARPTSAPRAVAAPVGHLPGRGLAHHRAVPYPEQGSLDVAGIGDDRAPEPLGRPGDGAQPAAHQPARQRLGHPQRQARRPPAARRRQLPCPRRRRRTRPSPSRSRMAGLFRTERRLRARPGSGLRGEANLDALDPAGQEGDGRPVRGHRRERPCARRAVRPRRIRTAPRFAGCGCGWSQSLLPGRPGRVCTARSIISRISPGTPGTA